MVRFTFHSYFTLISLLLFFLQMNSLEATNDILQGSVSFEEKVRNQSEIISLTNKQQEDIPLNKNHKPGTAMKGGFGIPVELTPDDTGFFEKSGDSLLVWKVLVESPGSVSMGLVLENFLLGDHSELVIYSADETFIAGPYTHKDNNDYQILSTPAFPVEQLIIQYTEPLNLSREDEKMKIRDSHFYVSEIIHIYQGGLFSDEKDLGSSGSCQVNINCSEGDQWQRQKRGVARILMRTEDDENEEISYSWCTGSLINNTAHDGTPYFLTAGHCGDEADTEDHLYWQFYFNFERPGCSNQGTPEYNMITGCSLLASAGITSASDFRLLLLNQTPPKHWLPYYNGWSRLDEPAQSGAGIHHPAGDAKKISTFTNELNSTTPTISEQQMAPNSAWQLNWLPTDNGHGVVEGGSSGSPLFNEYGLIVGTLTGGSSSCTNPYTPDYYGKFSYHWDKNGVVDVRQLVPFLDPLETGETEIPGFDPYHNEFRSPGFVQTLYNNEENLVSVQWYAPGNAPNDPGWFKYIEDYTHLSWGTPERATFFNSDIMGFSYPVTLSKVSHTFVEHESYPWPNDQFRFKIYDSDGRTLLYESEELTAEHFQEYIYTLEEPIILNDHFYVAVRSVDPSGHPSSLMRTINFGQGISFIGEMDSWSAHQDQSQAFAHLTGIYIEGSKKKNPVVFPQINSSGFAHQKMPSDKTTTVARTEQDPVQYRLYRNDQMIYETETFDSLEFTDQDVNTGLYRYYATALYEEEDSTYESDPSNVATMLITEDCAEQIVEFPYAQIFSDDILPDCWSQYSSGNSSWELTALANFNENDIAPQTGSHFLTIAPDSENQQEWIVTPFIDVTSLNQPAMRFSLISEAPDDDSKNALRVMIRTQNNSFREIWSIKGNESGYEGAWGKVVLNLSKYTQTEAPVQIAFLYEGENGRSYGIDNIELYNGQLYNLTLRTEPEDSDFLPGQVTGAGRYLEGEKVILRAYPNILHYFKNWETNTEVLSDEEVYRYTMPASGKTVKAMFVYSTTSAEEDLSGNSTADIYTVYPNPSTGIFTVGSPEASANIQVSVYDVRGSEILQKQIANLLQGETLEIDLRGQKAGLYFLVVETAARREVKKISLQFAD